jgi:hypothetical protein
VLDIESEIQKRIDRAQKYHNPMNNPALIRSYQTEIETLKTAPRQELQLTGAIRRLDVIINQTADVIECDALYSKREALEWLLQLVKYQKPLDPM